jgi:hypothetical protein
MSLVTAALLALAAPDVLVVDQSGGPGADFQSIWAAVFAAQDGDVLLIRTGSYSFPIDIDGKALTLVEDAGAEVRIPSCTVSNLTAEQTVVLRGLHFEGHYTSTTPTVDLFDNAGLVWMEDCLVQDGAPAVSVGAGCRAVLERCELVGVTGGWVFLFTHIDAGPALGSSLGTVTLHDCHLVGGDGEDGHPSETLPIGPDPGAPAYALDGGALFSSGSTFVGGRGGDGITAWDGTSYVCVPPEPGGAGLLLQGAAPIAHLLDTDLAGGAPGGPAGSCPPGAPGPSLDLQAGSAVTLPGSAISLALGPPVREGQTLTGTIAGAPGAVAFLAASTQPADVLVLPLSGVLHLAATSVVVAPGVLDASGELALAFPIAGIDGEGAVAWAQALTCASGECALGAAASFVVLDASL